MITSEKLESYQIPRFYQLLEEHGVNPLPTRSDFEAYRGELDGSVISIQINGEVSHENDRHLQELVDFVMSDLEEGNTSPSLQPPRDDSHYMVLAHHGRPSSANYPINHLNIWLSSNQYNHALDILRSATEVVEMPPKHDFEKHRFQVDQQTLRFHQNGKIIAEEGYSKFAPFLTEAIKQDLPFADYDLIIGQDEVGSGEHIGPLIIGAVGATPQQLVDLQLIGVKDSKMVPRGISSMLAHWIRDIASVAVINQINPPQFNQLRIEHQQSITDILTDAHNDTVRIVAKRLKHVGASRDNMVYLIDEYDRYERLSMFQDLNSGYDVNYITHGEQKSMAVAAASLLAKAARVRWINLHQKVYSIQLKRKHLNKIRQHDRAHYLLKSI